jgi:hypothetical protein
MSRAEVNVAETLQVLFGTDFVATMTTNLPQKKRSTQEQGSPDFRVRISTAQGDRGSNAAAAI